MPPPQPSTPKAAHDDEAAEMSSSSIPACGLPSGGFDISAWLGSICAITPAAEEPLRPPKVTAPKAPNWGNGVPPKAAAQFLFLEHSRGRGSLQNKQAFSPTDARLPRAGDKDATAERKITFPLPPAPAPPPQLAAQMEPAPKRVPPTTGPLPPSRGGPGFKRPADARPLPPPPPPPAPDAQAGAQLADAAPPPAAPSPAAQPPAAPPVVPAPSPLESKRPSTAPPLAAPAAPHPQPVAAPSP